MLEFSGKIWKKGVFVMNPLHLLLYVPEQKAAWEALERKEIGAFESFLRLLYGPLKEKFHPRDLESRRKDLFTWSWEFLCQDEEALGEVLNRVQLYCTGEDPPPVDFLQNLVDRYPRAIYTSEKIEACLVAFLPGHPDHKIFDLAPSPLSFAKKYNLQRLQSLMQQRWERERKAHLDCGHE